MKEGYETPYERILATIEPVVARYRLTNADIVGKSRSRPVVLARQHCFYQLRQAGFSYPTIGHYLDRDHSTVIHGCKEHAKRRDIVVAQELPAEAGITAGLI